MITYLRTINFIVDSTCSVDDDNGWTPCGFGHSVTPHIGRGQDKLVGVSGEVERGSHWNARP